MAGSVKTWWSNAKAQKELGVGSDFLKNLRMNGEIPYSKVHGTIFYAKEDLDDFFATNYVIHPIK